MPTSIGDWFLFKEKEVKKLRKQKNLKLIAATGVTIFSLFAAVTGAFAWFTSINSARNNVDGFGVYYDDSTITATSVYCIKYDGIYGASATKLVPNSTLTMSEYDYIFKDKNVNTPLFLRIEIEGYDRTRNLNIVIPSSGQYKTGSNTYVNNVLSNVVCAKFSYGLEQDGNLVRDSYDLVNDLYYGADIIDIYEGMKNNVDSDNGTPFVTNVSTGAKQSTISLSILKNTVNPSFIVNDKFVCYLVFDYYVTNEVNLVDNYISSYKAAQIVPNRTFNSDIGMISLRDSE